MRASRGDSLAESTTDWPTESDISLASEVSTVRPTLSLYSEHAHKYGLPNFK